MQNCRDTGVFAKLSENIAEPRRLPRTWQRTAFATNLDSCDKRLGVTITKVYLMRWRIEEYYKFKKQGFGFEKFLVRTLPSIRNLDLLPTIAIGYIGMLSEKIDECREMLEVIEAYDSMA